VRDFSEKLLASNRELLPMVRVKLEYPLFEPQSGQLQGIEWVGLFVWFYTEQNGDSDHMLANDDYDPAFMRCRVKTRIGLYDHRRLVRSFDGLAYTPRPLLNDTTPNDVAQTLVNLTGTFILPRLVQLGLPISKDEWTQQ
jgi:hypothetical protein